MALSGKLIGQGAKGGVQKFGKAKGNAQGAPVSQLRRINVPVK
jgi:hypothetical protein